MVGKAVDGGDELHDAVRLVGLDGFMEVGEPARRLGIGVLHVLQGGLDPLLQLGRADHTGMSAPAEDPALDLLEGIQPHTQLDSATGQVLELLRGMPGPFADQLGHRRVKLEPDPEIALALEDPEGPHQAVGEGEIRRLPEGASDPRH